MLGRFLPFLFLLSALGCGSKSDEGDGLPTLHPVKGVVNHGTKPMAKAVVQFRPEKDDLNQTLTINAETNERGEFELQTLTVKGNVKKPGAPEGVYTVSITPPQDQNQSGLPHVELRQKYTVKAGNNHFKLEYVKP